MRTSVSCGTNETASLSVLLAALRRDAMGEANLLKKPPKRELLVDDADVVETAAVPLPLTVRVPSLSATPSENVPFEEEEEEEDAPNKARLLVVLTKPLTSPTLLAMLP